MLRLCYRWLLRLHPARFRERFAAEMLSIFDYAEARSAAAKLVADAFVSLVRQWTMRSEYWEEKATVSVPAAADGSPVFFTLESFKPRKSSLIEGAVLTWIVYTALFLALSHGRIHYVYVPSAITESTVSPDIELPMSTPNLPPAPASVLPKTPPASMRPTTPSVKTQITSPEADRTLLARSMSPGADSPARIFEAQGQARFDASGELPRTTTTPVPLQSLNQPLAPARMSNESLLSYVGRYSTHTPNKFTVLITIENGHLVVEIPGEKKSTLIPVGGARFAYSQTQTNWVEFMRHDNGTAYGLCIHRNGSEFSGYR
jgi:hypothetical protein